MFWREIPRRGLERQVVVLLLRGVGGCVRHIAVRCSVGGNVIALLLADVEEVDGLGVNSQLCVRISGCAK